MTVATCHVCGTRTSPGLACTGCGTPVPSDAQPIAEPSGQHEYWESIQGRLTRATAPKYRVTGLLGYGGMSGVFAADEPRLGRRVAMKVLSPAVMVDAKLVERFMQEARTIARLSHPNIVAIHDVDERDGLHWFTMTYVPGRTLDEVMNETAVPISVPVARAWLHQVGDALAFAHAHGIVHRDVKPANVLLDLRGNALVTDFGIAKVTDVEQGLTRTGLLVGTPTYMSPEQCYGDPVTGASDQYSLGVLLYHILTGTAPFAGQTSDVLQAHMHKAPRPIRDLRPDCPDDLAGSVHRMLEKRPADRWGSLAAALTAAGATPPGFDNPLRVQMGRLAAKAARLRVEPRPVRLREGSQERLRITVEDGFGGVFTDRRIGWTSSQPAVAVIEKETLLGLSPGSTKLMASCGAASLSFEVAVEADPVGAVEMTRASAVVHAGEQTRLDARVAALDGSRLEGRVLLWSTSDPAVARVSATGVLTGIAPGDATITARSGAKYAASTVIVTPAPAVSPTTPDEPIRATPKADRVAPPKESDVAHEARAKRAWRQRAMLIVGAAARARRRAMLAVLSTLRRVAEAVDTGTQVAVRACRRAMLAVLSTLHGVAGSAGAATKAAARALRRGKLALLSTLRRTAVITRGAAQDFVRRLLTLTGTRRRSVAIASAVAVVALAVAIVIGRRVMMPAVAGQVEPAPPPELAPIAPMLLGAAGRTTAQREGTTPDARRAQGDNGPTPPALAVNGRILVAGDLPAGATVMISDPVGRSWLLSARPVSLAPGRYTVEFRAPGYEAESETIGLISGRTERWTPDLRPMRVAEPAPDPPARTPTSPPASAPPARDPEANQAAVLAAIEPFVAAFNQRDTDAVLPALPPSEQRRWRPVLEGDQVTEFSATLLPTTSVRMEENLASISFSVSVSYRTENELQGSYVTFFGFAERVDDGWQLYDLEYVSTQDFR